MRRSGDEAGMLAKQGRGAAAAKETNTKAGHPMAQARLGETETGGSVKHATGCVHNHHASVQGKVQP